MSGSVGRIYTQILNNDSILTIDCSNITISGECFINNILLTAGDYITASSTDTLTNKSIAYSQLTGTPTIPSNNNQLTNGAAFITASSSDTLTNKSIAYSQLTGTPTIPSNNNQLSNGAAFITASSSDTLTNKSIAYSQLTGTPTIPSNNNQLSNGSAYITASSTDTLTNKSIAYSQITGAPTVPTNTTQLTNGNGFITATSVDTLTNKSISYSQLTGTPTIPTNNNQLTNGSNYLSSGGAFTLPSSIGSSGQVLTVPSSGTALYFANAGGGGSKVYGTTYYNGTGKAIPAATYTAIKDSGFTWSTYGSCNPSTLFTPAGGYINAQSLVKIPRDGVYQIFIKVQATATNKTADMFLKMKYREATTGAIVDITTTGFVDSQFNSDHLFTWSTTFNWTSSFAIGDEILADVYMGGSVGTIQGESSGNVLQRRTTYLSIHNVD